MLPVDSLKHIQKMAEDAHPQRRIVTCEAEPDHVYYVLEPDGRLHRQIAVKSPERHTAADLATLVRVVGENARLANRDDMPMPEIWYSRTGVVGVLSPETGPDTSPQVRLALSPSPQLIRLMQWDSAGKAAPTQAELVILCRTLFAGGTPADFLPAIRQVRTQKQNEVNSQIAQGKVSLGKSLVAEMSGADKIPERISILAPVFAQAAVPYQCPIRIEIDPDPTNERFNLYVIPGEIETAFAYAEEHIERRLADELGGLGAEVCERIQLFRGQP